MVQASNRTCIKKLRSDAVKDYFEGFSFESGHIGYYNYPRSMEMTEMDAAGAEFPQLEFENAPDVNFPN